MMYNKQALIRVIRPEIENIGVSKDESEKRFVGNHL